MRQGQQNRRGRGRSNNNGGSNNNSNNSNHSHHNGRKPQNPLSRNYESSGPDVKIRGTAAQIAEKYMTLARDASSSGDSVTAENYLQHAEHYNRIIMAAQAQAATQHGGELGMNGHHRPQPQDGMNNYDMRDQPQPMIEQRQPQQQAQPPQPQAQAPQPAPVLPGMEPQPEVPTPAPAAAANGAPADAAPAAEEPAPADGRRRRRRYPAGGAAGRAAASAAEPVANGHNGTGNGLDSNESRPSDEALAN
jgi:hypothetical protein